MPKELFARQHKANACTKWETVIAERIADSSVKMKIDSNALKFCKMLPELG